MTKATIELEVRPFVVPNFVLVEKSELSLPLMHLDASTLERLCSEFRIAVFKKADVELPPEAV